MSYDFTLTSYCKACDTTTQHFNSNYTSNTSPMFYKVFPEGIKKLHNKDADEAVEILHTFWEYFTINKRELEELNPSNGWGDYESTLKLIKDMQKASFKAPNEGAVWTVYS